MRLALLVLALATLAPRPAITAAERGLPLVQETVDEIAVIRAVDCEHCKVVFIRDGAVLATRLAVEDMHFFISGDTFSLRWQDYWNAERVVDTKKLSLWVVEVDPTQDGQEGVWWCMRRNMRDLKQPENQ